MVFNTIVKMIDAKKIGESIQKLMVTSDGAARIKEMSVIASQLRMPASFAQTLLPSEADLAVMIDNVIDSVREAYTNKSEDPAQPLVSAEGRKSAMDGFWKAWIENASWYKQEVYDRQVESTKNVALETLLERSDRVNRVLDAVMPGILDLVLATQGNSREKDRAFMTKYYTEDLVNMSFDELEARARLRHGYVASGTLAQLLEASLEDLQGQHVVLALDAFKKALPPAMLAKVIHDVVGVAARSSAYLLSPAGQSTTELPAQINSDFDRCGVELLEVGKALKEAVVATQLPLFARFNEVVSLTNMLREEIEGALAPAKGSSPKPPAKRKPSAKKPGGPKPGESA